MKIKPLHIVLLVALAIHAGACTSVNIARYYQRNKPILDSIESIYKAADARKPFSIEFTDRPFERLSLELNTDSLTYIYEFFVGEDRMHDTLTKYGYDPAVFDQLITSMRSIECTWINKLDYYSEDRKQSMIYISIWPRIANAPFVNKKYYILTYFPQPQYFDSDGNLLTGRRMRRIRKINAETFKRITDKVCYTLSDRFR